MSTDNNKSSEDRARPVRSTRGVFFAHKRRLYIVVIILLVIIIGLLGYFIIEKQKQLRMVTPETQAIYDRIKELKSKGIPKSEIGKVGYYVSLGGAYADVGNDDQALKEYLNADKAISNRSASTGYSVNVAIAKLLIKDGNKSQAKLYLERELDRISKDPEFLAEPEGRKIIENLRSQIQELK